MSEEQKPKPPIVVLYGATIHNAVASGDLDQMKKIAAEAEAHLQAHGNVSAALETLKAEIAKLEASN
jgi:hypothetical protein